MQKLRIIKIKQTTWSESIKKIKEKNWCKKKQLRRIYVEAIK